MPDATPYSDQKNWSNDYLTDPKLLKLLGPFELDVATPNKMPWQTAARMISLREDGLKSSWVLRNGRQPRAFMNPPYRGVMAWAKKFAAHGNGIALLNGRSTETRATQAILAECSALWLPAGRLTFYKVSGTPWPQKWFPSLLIGMTDFDASRLLCAAKVYGGAVLDGPEAKRIRACWFAGDAAHGSFGYADR